MIQCRLLIDPPGPGAWNMAVDEMLLEWSAATARLLPAILSLAGTDAVAGVFSGVPRPRRPRSQPELPGRAAVDRRRGHPARRRVDLQPGRPRRTPAGSAAGRALPGRPRQPDRDVGRSGHRRGMVPAGGPFRRKAPVPFSRPGTLSLFPASRGGRRSGGRRRRSPAAPNAVAAAPCSSTAACSCGVRRPRRNCPPWTTPPARPSRRSELAERWREKLAPRLAVVWVPGVRTPAEDLRAAELVKDRYGSAAWTEYRGRSSP